MVSTSPGAITSRPPAATRGTSASLVAPPRSKNTNAGKSWAWLPEATPRDVLLVDLHHRRRRSSRFCEHPRPRFP
jgi:hypothetical protein